MEMSLPDLLTRLNAEAEEYSRSPAFADRQKNCFYHRDALAARLVDLDGLRLLRYRLIPAEEETTTFRYIDGNVYLQHALLGVLAADGVIVIDPYLPGAKAVYLQEYLSRACIDPLDAYLVISDL